MGYKSHSDMLNLLLLLFRNEKCDVLNLALNVKVTSGNECNYTNAALHIQGKAIAISYK